MSVTRLWILFNSWMSHSSGGEDLSKLTRKEHENQKGRRHQLWRLDFALQFLLPSECQDQQGIFSLTLIFGRLRVGEQNQEICNPVMESFVE